MSPVGHLSRSIPALVTDAHLRSVVAGLRALGRDGVPVVALAPGRRAAGLWSRHACERRVGPGVVSDPAGYVEAIERAARDRGRLVAYPGWERALQAVLDARARLPDDIVLPYPDNASVAALRDKRRLAELAAGSGVEPPRTLAQATAGELRTSTVGVPCVVKPATSVAALESAHVVSGEEELRALLEPLPEREPLLVQERVRGALGAVALVIGRDGRLVARFQQSAERTWPAEAGVSALAVSVAPDESFVSRLVGMLAGAGYWGLVQLQFLQTDSDRVLIDANPRFYGSLPLALAAGVNLPAAWHAVAVDDPTPRPGPYRVGVRYRWLEADLVAAARGEGRRLLPSRRRPAAGAMWASDDPLPGAALAVDAVWSRIRRRLPHAATERAA